MGKRNCSSPSSLKTYVLMLSREFPGYHPRCGQPTEFRSKYGKGVKKHTLRANAELWERRAAEVNAGRAVLSVRQWSGRPYEKGSHQEEIFRLTRLGTQRVTLLYRHYGPGVCRLPYLAEVHSGRYHPKVTDLDVLASNDGLSCEDFRHWFPHRGDAGEDFHGVILHFTDMRY